MLAALRNLLRNTKAATAIEYGLLGALIAVAAIAGFQNFGDGLVRMWGNVSTAVVGS